MLAVALLRGINVGGRAKVPMAQLRDSFEALGCTDVQTYIASGNVLFAAPATVRTAAQLRAFTPAVEERLASDFGFDIAVILRSHRRLRQGVDGIPADWSNDHEHRTDVLFLFDGADRAGTLDGLARKDGVDEAVYAPGLIAWRVPRAKVTRSRLTAIGDTAVPAGDDSQRHDRAKARGAPRRARPPLTAVRGPADGPRSYPPPS